MEFENKMKDILNRRKNLHFNDAYGIQKSWDEIIEVLTENEKSTLRYLENCSKKDLYWTSEVFEEIAEGLQSKKLISCLRNLDKKYPELEMKKDINLAENYIKNA